MRQALVAKLHGEGYTDQARALLEWNLIESEIMQPILRFDEICERVVGHRVTYRRLAANSLIIYVDSKPGDNHGVLFWFEPTWNLQSPDGVLTGSRQAQHDESTGDPDAGFKAAAKALDIVIGRRVDRVESDLITGDLRMVLEGELKIQTFVSDPTSEELWHIRDRSVGVFLRGSPRGMLIVDEKS